MAGQNLPTRIDQLVARNEGYLNSSICAAKSVKYCLPILRQTKD